MLKCNPELSNYKIVYGLSLDDDSKIGLVITLLRILEIRFSAIQIKNVDSLEVYSDLSATPFPEVQDKTFYGIWCFASND